MGPLDTSGWAKCASNSSRQACRVRPEPGQLLDRALAQRRDQLGGRGAGLVGIVVLVEVHDLLRDRPGDGDLAVRVAGDQPGLQPGPGLGRQVIGAAAQDPADAIQRVAGAAAVPGLGVLDPAAHVIERGQGEPDHVKRVQHPHRVGQLAGQGGGVAAERVQRGGG